MRVTEYSCLCLTVPSLSLLLWNEKAEEEVEEEEEEVEEDDVQEDEDDDDDASLAFPMLLLLRRGRKNFLKRILLRVSLHGFFGGIVSGADRKETPSLSPSVSGSDPPLPPPPPPPAPRPPEEKNSVALADPRVVSLRPGPPTPLAAGTFRSASPSFAVAAISDFRAVPPTRDFRSKSAAPDTVRFRSQLSAEQSRDFRSTLLASRDFFSALLAEAAF